MDGLLNSLDFWLMIVTIAAGVYYFVWKDRVQPIIHWLARVLSGAVQHEDEEDRAPRVHRRPASRVRVRPLRSAIGQFQGSVPARFEVPESVPDAERVPEVVPASRADVSDGNEFPAVPVSVPEIVQITLQLAQGVSPSVIAKTLPGYSSREYQTYMAKVRNVQTEMAAVAPTQGQTEPVT